MCVCMCVFESLPVSELLACVRAYVCMGVLSFMSVCLCACLRDCVCV